MKRPSLLARLVLGITAILLVALLTEVSGQVVYRFFSREKVWLFRGPLAVFEPHPYLVGVPKPGAVAERNGLRIEHHQLGWRGPKIAQAKAPGVLRIATIGGSSTYCTGLSNGQTWPERLATELGERCEVVNLGVPGYNTAEHLIQSALLLSDLQIDVAVYYVGWNDVRTMHVRGLTGDYADFHGRRQLANLGLDGSTERSRSFLVRYLGRAWHRLFPGKPPAYPDAQALTPVIDQRALAYYRRNLKSLATLCAAQGIRAVFIPQRMNDAKLTGAAPTEWSPFVRQQDMPAAIAAYNDVLRTVAAETNTTYATRIATAAFPPEDYLDEGHWSEAGARKFAALLAEDLRPLLSPR